MELEQTKKKLSKQRWNFIDCHTLQALLQTIGQIVSTHGQYKRSPDAMFKAFVSAGLKLVLLLNITLHVFFTQNTRN